MEDENIFEYGPYKLYKDAFKENLAKNIDKYIKDHNLTDPETEQDFRAAVDFIRDGIGSYITHMNGSGLFKDNKGYLTSTRQGHKYAANYINFVANKQGALGNATPKKKEEKEIVEEKEKTLFDPNKHLIGLEFESTANPLGNDSSYSLWKEGLNDPLGQLRQYIATHKASLDNYDFSGTNLTKDFYEKSLNSLLSSLGDNEISEKDAEVMLRLGFKNPKAFMPQQIDPTPTVSNISEERLAQLMNSNWKVDPTSKNWLDPTGYNTQLPATVDPENPGDKYKEQFAAYQQYLRGNNSVTNIIDEDDPDWFNILTPIALDTYSILSPEPISATSAGLISDFWTWLDSDKNTKDNIALGTNLLGTAAGIVPYVGDVFNLKKWANKVTSPAVRKSLISMLKFISPAVATYGTKETIDNWDIWLNSFNNIMNGGDGDWSAEDIRNSMQLLMSAFQIYKGQKAQKKFGQIQRDSELDLNTSASIRGKDKDGNEREYIVTGENAKKAKEAKTIETLNDQLKDLGVEFTQLPSNKKHIYNPELARQMAGEGAFNKTRGLVDLKMGKDSRMLGEQPRQSTETSSTRPNKPTKIKTVDDLRNTIKAKLQAEGKSAEDLQAIDEALKSLKTGGFKSLYKGKAFTSNTKEYEEVVKLLKTKADFSEDAARKILNKIGAYKEGGILKAQAGNTAPITGTPKNTNPWYNSIGTHFMTDLIKSISDSKFTYMDVNMMQDRHSDLESRLEKTVDNPIFDSATEQYYKDINQFGFVNNKGIKAGEDAQRYKVNPNANTGDTYNEDPNKAWNPDGYYSGRGQDRTLLGRKGDYSDEELATVTQAWKDAGYEMYLNDKNNYYYLREIAVASEGQKSSPKESIKNNEVKPGEVDGSGLTGDNNSKEITPTGDPMTKKPNRNWEPAFSAFNYFNALRTNKRILDKTNELTPLLYDPVEHHRTIHGDLQAIAEGQKQAAEFERQAATPMTSDGSLQQAMQMEAKLKGQESIRAGLKADNDEVKRTTDLAIAQEKENKNVRHQVAMKNRENMHQVDLTKLQAETTKIRSDYESTKNFVDEIKRYYATEHAKKQKIDDTIYARALQQDIYKNPQNYMPGWNTYHDDIWKKGIAGKQLTSEEQTVFAQLKQQFTNAYYSNLYYNTTPIDTSVKDITGSASDWAIVRSLATQKTVKEEKRGGKLTKDDAKIVLEFLKESNKNYNKAVDRSARGMYNHIKLQRKK